MRSHPTYQRIVRQGFASPDRRHGRPRSAAILALAGALALLLPVAGTARGEAEDGFHVTPSVFWKNGDQRFDLTVTSRFRTEWWDAHAAEWDTFYALRTRVAGKYSFKDRVILFGEFQDVRIYDMGFSASGAGGLYRRFGATSSTSRTHGDNVRQLWAEVRPIEGLSIRGGRQDIKLGTQALYPEPNWKYLKIERASQRLVGTVGWTHGERSNDGFTVAYDTGGHHVYAFVANPTTGVFDLNSGYHRQEDIVYGGVSWTVKRGTWLENTELRGFFLAYNDDRPIKHGGMPNEIDVYTLGFSVIGIHPVGPGNFDLLLWGAGQAGEYNERDHIAAAAIVEAGYQFTDVVAKPWLRAGVNFATGGNDRGDHTTFFNMLPTNHLYYGFADRLAFQNLVDLFGQLMFEPHERVGFNVMLHHFWLADDDDFQYFGTGAFTKKANFGIGGNSSRGKNDFGLELDLIASVKLCSGLSLAGGYSRLWGHGMLNALADDDVDFAFLQLTMKY